MPYEVREENIERQRLLEKVNGPTLDMLLDRIMLPRRARCLDLGCGIGEGTRHLARRLPTDSEVVGVDVDPALVRLAEATPSTENARITYRQGDANALDLQDHSFDLVYARSLLQHIQAPQGVLSEMLRVCRRGGIVAVQEGDARWLHCYPDNWAYERVGELWGRLLKHASIGRMLWSLFRAVGHHHISLFVDCRPELDGNDSKRFIRLCHEATRSALVAAGLVSETEFDKILEELRRVEEAGDVLFVGIPLYTAWVVSS